MRWNKSLSKTSVVVVVVIVAVMLFVCTGLCAGLIMPAINMSRDAARKQVSTNNLKQIGLALHMYHSVHKTFPPAFLAGEDGQPKTSWRALVLPYLDLEGGGAYDPDAAWDAPQNRAAAEKYAELFASPFVTEEGLTPYVAITGPNTALATDGAVAVEDIADGTSNTVMVIEDVNHPVPWNSPEDISPEELLSRYQQEDFPPTPILLLMGDGSVQQIDFGNPATLKAMIDRNDGR